VSAAPGAQEDQKCRPQPQGQKRMGPWEPPHQRTPQKQGQGGEGCNPNPKPSHQKGATHQLKAPGKGGEKGRKGEPQALHGPHPKTVGVPKAPHPHEKEPTPRRHTQEERGPVGLGAKEKKSRGLGLVHGFKVGGRAPLRNPLPRG
jgi:hypothetical protein